MCADPRLRGALLQELRQELAAIHKERDARQDCVPAWPRGWVPAVMGLGAPAAVIILLVVLAH